MACVHTEGCLPLHVSLSASPRDRKEPLLKRQRKNQPIFMLTFDIWMVSFRDLCRTVLSRQTAATALPRCVHARSERYLSLSFVMHLGEDRTLPSCLFCVKTPKVARPFTSSCILTCLNSRNTFPSFLSKLQTSSVHTTGFFFFLNFLILCHLLTHACTAHA